MWTLLPKAPPFALPTGAAKMEGPRRSDFEIDTRHRALRLVFGFQHGDVFESTGVVERVRSEQQAALIGMPEHKRLADAQDRQRKAVQEADRLYRQIADLNGQREDILAGNADGDLGKLISKIDKAECDHESAQRAAREFTEAVSRFEQRLQMASAPVLTGIAGKALTQSHADDEKDLDDALAFLSPILDRLMARAKDRQRLVVPIPHPQAILSMSREPQGAA